MSIAEECRKTGLQRCCFCDDITCCDNTTSWADLYRSKMRELKECKERIAELESEWHSETEPPPIKCELSKTSTIVELVVDAYYAHHYGHWVTKKVKFWRYAKPMPEAKS